MDKVFSVRLDDEDAEQVETLAKKEERKDAAMLRILIREALEARAKAKVPA